MDRNTSRKVSKTINLQNVGMIKLLMIPLGAMNMRKQETTAAVLQVMQIDIKSIYTVPMYNHKSYIGFELKDNGNTNVMIEVPKR